MERSRKPTTPGEIIKMHYLEPLNMTITDLASSVGISRKTLSAIINGRRAVTVDIAMRLSKALATTPQLWLNLQNSVDIWQASQLAEKWQNIQPLPEILEGYGGW